MSNYYIWNVIRSLYTKKSVELLDRKSQTDMECNVGCMVPATFDRRGGISLLKTISLTLFLVTFVKTMHLLRKYNIESRLGFNGLLSINNILSNSLELQ